MTYFRRPSKAKGESGDPKNRHKEHPELHESQEDKNTRQRGPRTEKAHQAAHQAKPVGPYVDDAQDLISEIHQLLNGVPLDIVDLKRPVGRASGDEKPLASNRHHPDHGATQNDLNADVVAQTSQAINEFTRTVQVSMKEGLKDREELPQAKDHQHTQGFSLDTMVKQAVSGAVSEWMDHNTEALEEAARHIMMQHMPSFVAQWLNKHLPDQLRQSIDQHLQTIAHTARKPHTHSS